MSAADLSRLIHRATPRVEDVRSPDRTDIIRRNHGHLSLREIVDAVDALEFSSSTFLEFMPEVLASQPADAVETAVHSLYHALSGMRILSLPAQSAPSAPELPEKEGAEGWQEKVAEAKGKGGECFKAKDFSAALAHYSAAIEHAASSCEDLKALFSNRSAARLQLGEAKGALADAQVCVRLAKDWPKAHFREGAALRQLELLPAAAAAFARGRALEPGNADWGKELEKVEKAMWERKELLARQLLLKLLPELLRAWLRGGKEGGVLQLQVMAELADMGVPKYRMVREGKPDPKAQLRYAFLGKKEYLANLAENLKSPPEGVAVRDIADKPLNIAEVMSFVSGDEEAMATVHLDVKEKGKKMVAILARIPCDEKVRMVVGTKPDPDAPKGSVEAVLNLQKSSGFPKSLPSLLGFQAFPGQLNFPVIDVARDVGGAS